MKKTKLVCLLLIFAFCIASLTACGRAEQYFVYGTTLTIKADDARSAKDVDKVYEYINALESLLSPTVEGSDVYNVNHAQKNVAVKCSQITMEVALAAKVAFEQSDGAYDPSVYPLVRLWKFSGDTFGIVGQDITPPTDDEINENLKLVGFDRVFSLDFENNTITKNIDGAMLDFGGIAKGYAVRKCLDLTSGKMLVNLGGNIGAAGKSYRIGVANPSRQDRAFSTAYYARFELQPFECVSTSGDYERYYTSRSGESTVYYPHIIDTATGYPVDTAKDDAVVSCTIISTDGALGDAIATAVVVLGKERGVQLIRSLGLKGVVITSDLQCEKVGDFSLEIQ